MTTTPEFWLRGPIEGIHPILQPAAHTILQTREDVLRAVDSLPDDLVWKRPGGTAAIGFHLMHVPGSMDRLFTYSRGADLTPAQLADLERERAVYEHRPTLSQLLTGFTTGVDDAIAYLRTVPEETHLTERHVGRKRLPSTTLGLIFHAAEHSSRHAGQIVTLSKVVRAS